MHHRFHFHSGGRFARRGHDPISHHRPDLQLALLALLADKPRYGYEVVQELAESSRAFRTPGPSMVYPALTYLEEIGHATATAEGARTRYDITETGRQHLNDATRGRRGSTESQHLWLARRALKGVLREKKTASPEEQQRIVEILKRATAEISGPISN